MEKRVRPGNTRLPSLEPWPTASQHEQQPLGAGPPSSAAVAVALTNFNPLIADGHVGKTGSELRDRRCLAFVAHVSVAGRGLTVVGVAPA